MIGGVGALTARQLAPKTAADQDADTAKPPAHGDDRPVKPLRIEVCVPAYNHEQFVERCLRSRSQISPRRGREETPSRGWSGWLRRRRFFGSAAGRCNGEGGSLRPFFPTQVRTHRAPSAGADVTWCDLATSTTVLVT